MAKTLLTDNQKDFIRANYLKISSEDIGKAIGLSRTVVAGFKNKNNLIVPKELSRQFAIQKALNRTTCTPDDDRFIKENYLSLPPQRIADRLGCSEQKVKTRMRQLTLVVPADIIEQRKKDSRISKGNIPFNKGKKQDEFMSPEAIERTIATRFKKGSIPHNSYNEPGRISIRTDHKHRSGRMYKYICLALGKWKPLHTHLWEEEFGKLPKNHCLWFKDGDSLNVTLENLECITRAENVIRNANHDNPSDNRIAFYMAKSSRQTNKELQKELLHHPELIEAKKQQILINRKIKNHGTKQTIRS